MKLLVKDLRVGDKLAASGQTVTAEPYRHARCKAGQVRIGIDGRWRIWRADTEVGVERAQPEPPTIDL